MIRSPAPALLWFFVVTVSWLLVFQSLFVIPGELF